MKEYLVISRANGVTRNGSPYAQLKVAALDETMNISVWDVPPTAGPVVGQTVFFYNIKDNAGKKSCSLTDMKVGEMPLLDHPLYNLLPRPVRRAHRVQVRGEVQPVGGPARLPDIAAMTRPHRNSLPMSAGRSKKCRCG